MDEDSIAVLTKPSAAFYLSLKYCSPQNPAMAIEDLYFSSWGAIFMRPAITAELAMNLMLFVIDKSYHLLSICITMSQCSEVIFDAFNSYGQWAL